MEATYPGIKVFWCSFHCIQAAGRNIRDKDRNISAKNQAEMTQLFKEAQTAVEKKKASDSFNKLISRCKAMNEHRMAKYFLDTFGRDQEKWFFSFHTFINRGQSTNNYSESHMLTLKSNILERLRSYNVVALLDYIIDRMDNVYVHRLEKFSSGEISSRIREINSHMDQISGAAQSIPSRYVIGTPPVVQVRSTSYAGVKYDVDLDKCSCTCVAGYTGKCCKHLFRASQVFKLPLHYLREYSQHSRYEAAALAFGSQNVAFEVYHCI